MPDASPEVTPNGHLQLSERTSDKWVWTAFYRDGAVLEEYGADGDHGFGEIDFKRLWLFQLTHVDGSGRAYGVTIEPGQRPIFFRRRASNSPTGEPGYHMLTCIGRQETVKGKNVSTYAFFDDDGHVLIADRGDAV